MRLSGSEVVDLAHHRSQQLQDDVFRWNNIAKILDGKHHELFPRELPRISGPYPNRPAPFVRRAWRQFTNLVGKVPDVYATPLGNDSAPRNTADRLEKIARGYHDVWGMHRKMRTLASLTSAFGAAGMGVIPDPNLRYPMFIVEDPRHVLPGPAWHAASSNRSVPSFIAPAIQLPFEMQADMGGPLCDCIIRKTLTGYQLRQLYGARVQDFITNTESDLHQTYTVFQYADTDHWITVLSNARTELSVGEHGLGWCPFQYYALFNPGDQTSTSDLEQQIGLEVAFMRILNQKLELNDGVAFPWLLRKGWVEVDPATREIVAGSPDSDASFLTPPATFQVDKDLGMISEMLRIFNWETETSQGSAGGGPITGRGLTQLDTVRVAAVQAFFEDYAFYLPPVYATAFAMDRLLFGGSKKQLAGRLSGEPFLLDYDPATDIPERFGRITVEFGPGVGGYEGHLQMLQDLGADAISQDTIMRKNPYIRSVQDEQRKIMREKIIKVMFEQALKGEAAVPFDWLAQLAQVLEKREDPLEWIAANPPGQNTATPQSVGPVPPGALPPELAGAMGALGGGPPGAGAPPGGPGGMVQPPPLGDFIARLGGGRGQGAA